MGPGVRRDDVEWVVVADQQFASSRRVASESCEQTALIE
jgi:hypothetical protein